MYNTRQGLRSLIHLRRPLTRRADDSRAAPVQVPFGVPSFLGISQGFQALVRFLAQSRIEPHDPPLVRVPAYFFEF